MFTNLHQLDGSCEHLEFERFLTNHRKPPKERDYGSLDIAKRVHFVVPATVARPTDCSATQRPSKQFERSHVYLGGVESRRDSPTSSVVRASPAHQHEASFPEGKPREEMADVRRYCVDGKPFLLIVRTRCIVRRGRANDFDAFA